MDPIIIIVLIVVIIIVLIYSYPESHENFTNDEAIQNVASLYNSGMATVTNLNATGVATLSNLNAGNININGDVMTGKGRVHLTGPELLYLLNKSGVIIGKEWGGNGNLTVQGDANIGGQLMATGAYNPNVSAALNDLNNRLNTINTNMANVGNCNWDGDRSIFGGNGGCEDDYTFTCQNKKLVRVRNHCNA